jgi:hypothetical protein
MDIREDTGVHILAPLAKEGIRTPRQEECLPITNTKA